MTSRVDWLAEMEPMGRAVIALGVFDGVHAGHQALLNAAILEARRLDAISVALTFDRDPDQVVHPEAAAPELLCLDDRLHALAATGLDVVLVVPFTSELAATAAEEFLDTVLIACCEPVSIHVGSGFRFGAHAEGNLDTLYVWGIEHNAEVRPHELVHMGNEPVSSTRIRAHVAAGEVRAAADLLTRPTRIRGSVHRGRGEGVSLGFATANVTPDAHAALPADGVYAGRAVLEDGARWVAAISVGTPPTFPEAHDYVEAHLIGFEGDLYGATIALEFIERLRAQESFGSVRMLSEAIAADVARTLDIVREYELSLLYMPAEVPPDRSALLGDAFMGILTSSDELEDGTPVVADPLALEAAERAAAGAPALATCGSGGGEDWVVVFGPARLSAMLSDGGAAGALITGPLQAAGIEFSWDPIPPGRAQTARPDLNWFRQFRLRVPARQADEAREILATFRD